MILIPLVPAIAWAFLPPWSRPWVTALAASGLILAAIMFVRRMQGGWTQTVNAPGRADWRWRRHWSASAFRQHLQIYLEECGLSVVESAAPDDGRVLMILERARVRAALLCIRPDLTATAEDAALLLSLRKERDAEHALLVAEQAEAVADEAGVMRLPFKALGKPDEIGGWVTRLLADRAV